MAEPFNFSVMIGSAILKDVASSAAARVMIQIDANANIKALPGLNSAWKSSNGGILECSLVPGNSPLLIGDCEPGDGFSLESLRDVEDIMEDGMKNDVSVQIETDEKKKGISFNI